MPNPGYESSNSDQDSTEDEGAKGGVDDMDTKSGGTEDKQHEQSEQTEADNYYLDILEQIKCTEPRLYYHFWFCLLYTSPSPRD